jgi:two-component system chemotaxis response regulator CheY
VKILIVDDEFVSRNKAQKILSQYGECDIAISGNEALEAFQFAHEDGKPYDLITMDIIMPDMDGVEALHWIREYEESANIEPGEAAKVLMLTASKAPDSIWSSFQKGCEAYVTKPFNRQDLVKQLNRLEFSLSVT